MGRSRETRRTCEFAIFKRILILYLRIQKIATEQSYLIIPPQFVAYRVQSYEIYFCSWSVLSNSLGNAKYKRKEWAPWADYPT